MKTLDILLGAAFAVASVTSASASSTTAAKAEAAPAAASAAAAKPAAAKSDQICRYQSATGSRLRTNKVCLTAAEWATLKRDGELVTTRAKSASRR